jgi:hypothetical protein
LRHTLEFVRALVLRDEQPSDLPLHRGGDEHRAGLGRGLHARRDIGRFAEHFARSVDHDGSGIESNAGGELRGAFACVSGVDLRESALDG